MTESTFAKKTKPQIINIINDRSIDRNQMMMDYMRSDVTSFDDLVNMFTRKNICNNIIKELPPDSLYNHIAYYLSNNPSTFNMLKKEILVKALDYHTNKNGNGRGHKTLDKVVNYGNTTDS